MKDRIKLVRKANNLSRQAFADELKLSRASIESFEIGRRELTDRTISDICRVYGVNEEWLRNGTGEMFKPLDREQRIAKITKQLLKEDDNSFRLKLVEIFSNLSSEGIDTLKRYAEQLLEEENGPE